MNDADAGRHDLEGIEGLLAPFQELVALLVAMEFEIKVAWSPGADMSGCLIEVKHPSLTNAKAYLFMNY